MSRVKNKALIGIVSLLCVCAQAQDVTVSARVKVIDNHLSSESLHADNVVVWLTPIGAEPKAKFVPKQPLVLVQHHKSFEPHLLVVPVGAVVQFPNRDPFFHNVFSLFEGKRFDLGLYEAGTTRNVSFDRPGISFIFCNIHAEMSAIVVALETPYYGISNRKGEVVIPQVPPGHYTLKTWAETALPENLNALTREVTVSDNSSSMGVLEITAGMVSTAHKNKFGMDYEPPAPNSPGYQQP
jgi:plastocyanin